MGTNESSQLSHALTDNIQPEHEYTIAAPLEISHTVGRMRVEKVQLNPGDVITVISFHPRKGLHFRILGKEILVSPEVAASMQVDADV